MTFPQVVKLTGLEAVFIQRVIKARQEQLDCTFYFTLYLQLVVSLLKLVPQVVNAATIITYVEMKKILQEEFAIVVMPVVSFLNMMTSPASQVCERKMEVKDQIKKKNR
jgi:hypothetical protein